MITDEEIYYSLLGNIVIPGVYHSPLPAKYRKTDHTASFSLREHEGEIVWRDWGLAAPWGNKAVNLVAYIYEFAPETEEEKPIAYKKALRVINTEIANGVLGKKISLKKTTRLNGSAVPYLTWNESFTESELDYWSKFDLSTEELHYEQIYGLRSLEWTNSLSKTFSTRENPAFVYIFRNNPISWKLYRPLSPDKTQKFRQWNVSEIVEGGHLLDEETYDLGIITSSTKDRVVVRKAFAGESVCLINPTSEGTYFALVSLWSKIKHYAKKWLIMFDADEAGYNCGVVLSGHLNIPNIDMRGKLAGQKDFSDFIDKKKGNNTYKQLNSLIKQLIL